MRWVNKEIFRVRGSYLVCVGLNLCLRTLAPSEDEAIKAQDAYYGEVLPDGRRNAA